MMAARLARGARSVLLARPSGLAHRALIRPLSTAVVPPIDDEAAWEASWLKATEDVYDSSRTFEESAEGLRQLIKTGLLRHTDLRDRPERFFKAHRLLARHAVQHGPGFWIRFTVHYNLCFGTVLAVGTPEQIASMETVEAEGLLGCFALTEKLAGVQSGLIVQTKATYDSESQTFTLTNVKGDDKGAYKNWISQGHVADKTVVLADLTVNNERKGPHAFLMDLRKDGVNYPGVSTGDMGIKTVGNDLDNAWIAFDKVKLPRTALLSRYAEIDASTGDYKQVEAGIKPFEMIGQRLYTGRVAVAQAALSYRRKLFEDTKAYADNKRIPSFVGSEPLHLSSIPQLKSLFEEAEETAAALEAYVSGCELELTPLLKAGEVPSEALAHKIAVAKVKAVEHSIDLCWRLKQEVGSYALMGDSGFGSMDFLQCCKFAEGDSRVLMLKMARDRLRRFGKEMKSKTPVALGEEEEAALCGQLAKALGAAKGDKAMEASILEGEWRLVYGLAESIMSRTLVQAEAEELLAAETEKAALKVAN